MKDILIINPGLYTTIQDRGRWGYQEFGMPVAGAMDDYSFRVANILVGNDEYEAVMEATLNGPEIQFNIDAVVAITGANMLPKLNGYSIPMWRSIKISKGDTLSFEMAREGARAYIAFAGGMDILPVMGSCSTFARGGIGGHEGRKLKANDELGLRKTPTPIQDLVNRTIPVEYIPNYQGNSCIRAILGPQDDCFTNDSIERFFSSEYEVTNEADRMGYRLSGPTLEHKAGADIISDGISFGSIQIPGHGMPIVMMADRQTTGGYTKIATVVSTDMPLMAQFKPGDKIRFEKISVYKAHMAVRDYEKTIKEIKNYVRDNQLKPLKSKRYSIIVGGTIYDALVEELE